jgi:hypothetical protein
MIPIHEGDVVVQCSNYDYIFRREVPVELKATTVDGEEVVLIRYTTFESTFVFDAGECVAMVPVYFSPS